MLATDLSAAVWNAIADLVRHSKPSREIYFVKVKKVDKIHRVIYADEFGDTGIPLVGFTYGSTSYDTQPDGTITKRGEDYETNDAYHSRIVLPKRGQIVVVIDPEGAKSFPFCIGVIQSTKNYWEDTSGN